MRGFPEGAEQSLAEKKYQSQFYEKHQAQQDSSSTGKVPLSFPTTTTSGMRGSGHAVSVFRRELGANAADYVNTTSVSRGMVLKQRNPCDHATTLLTLTHWLSRPVFCIACRCQITSRSSTFMKNILCLVRSAASGRSGSPALM